MGEFIVKRTNRVSHFLRIVNLRKYWSYSSHQQEATNHHKSEEIDYRLMQKATTARDRSFFSDRYFSKNFCIN